MLRIVAACAFIATAACATPGQVISSNPSNVVVRHDGSYQQATALAVQRCAAYGKDARLVHTEGFIMSFDCVQR